MLELLAYIFIFAGIAALFGGDLPPAMLGLGLGAAILGTKYLYANRKCPTCGKRGGLYKWEDGSYGPVINGTQEYVIRASGTSCKHCAESKELFSNENENNLEILRSKTCRRCGKYNSDWDEIKDIYQSETINGVVYQKYIYIRKCKHCSNSDNRISEWL